MIFPVHKKLGTESAPPEGQRSPQSSGQTPHEAAAELSHPGAFGPDRPLGYKALRRDAPERLPYQKGARADLSSAAARREALATLETDMYAASSQANLRYKRKLVSDLLAEWGHPVVPLTIAKLKCLGASLKAGRYRSGPAIVSQFKTDAERRGEVVSPAALRTISDVNRSCARGQGPAVTSAPLPLELLGSLPGAPAPWCKNGPIGPRNAMICGSWWMTREIELATARAAALQLICGPAPLATLLIPASKADQREEGVARTYVCMCQGGPPRRECPAHAAWD